MSERPLDDDHAPMDDLHEERGGGIVSREEREMDADERVEALIEAEAGAQQIAVAVEEQEPADAAETLESLEPKESKEVVHEMDNESAADALSHMDPALAATVLLDMEDSEVAQIIALMAPDDAADIIQELPKGVADHILTLLPPRDAAIVGKLAVYDPESAGGVMTTEIIVVRDSMTIGRAIEFVKRHHISDEQSDVFVADEQRRLVGTIGLRTLIVAEDGDAVSLHMDGDIDFVTPEQDREEVARLFDKYDLRTLAVVDEHQRVLGMVTVDDVIDIIAEEATEDTLKSVGAGADEAVYSRVMDKIRGRLPWLAVNLPMAAIGSSVILLAEPLVKELPIVAAVYPVIANQSGNAGNQSMAVTLRGLVLGEIRKGRLRPLVVREVLFGAVSGLVLGGLFALGLTLLGMIGRSTGTDSTLAGFDWPLALVAGLAMGGAFQFSVLVGLGVPMALQRLGKDPATASTIFVTMMTDLLSYSAFLGLVFLLKPWLMGG
ncbi:MAG: magnesium transporter [Phycisphaerales bacterium]|nr:magnesium transporter [Phycisphaerales bacterium]